MKGQAPRGTKLKKGIKVVVDVTVMITIGETVTMDEMEVGEGEEEGGVVGITEVGTTDRRTGIWIVMIEDPCLLDGICGVDEADRGALHREVPDTVIFHGGASGPGVLPVWTHANHRRLRSQPP